MSLLPRIDPNRLAILRECMEHYDVGDPGADWPNNVVSRRALAYHDGTIALADKAVVHDVDDAEVYLCERLSAEAVALMDGVSVGMGSEADSPFGAFFVAAPLGSVGPRSIDAEVIRRCFGGTLFPPVPITVEPLVEDTVWWTEIIEDGEGLEPGYIHPWQAMTAWFQQEPAFKHVAFVRVGSGRELARLAKDTYPPGTVMPGSVLPRLVLGLTHRGSLAGLFGQVVQS